MARVMRAVVGSVLALDACVTVLILLLWAVRGHVPDFLTTTVFGVWSVATVTLKTVGGGIAAVQLLHLERGGRPVAGVILANNALYAIAAGVRAGALMNGTLWATVALYAVMLVMVLLAPESQRGVRQRVSTSPTRAARR